jgi:hypothetical protein
MFSLLADLQKERGFPHPSRKKQLLKFKRESTLAAGLSGRKNQSEIPLPRLRDRNDSDGGGTLLTLYFRP